MQFIFKATLGDMLNCLHVSYKMYFLAHLSRRLIGELIHVVYPCSVVRPSSTISKIFFSETAGPFHVTFVLILHFDWLQGPQIGQNFEKHSKIFFSETVKGMKPIHCIHVPDSGLYIIGVFYSRRIRTLVAMAT